MFAYKYNTETKLYAGVVNCQIDPIETQRTGHDIWLLPANSTFVEPLPEKEGFNIVWNGSMWEYQEIPQPEPQPEPEPPTHEEIREMRAEAYRDEVDPITSHISRLRDAEQTEEIIAEIAELVAERDAKVAEIKERYPYPTDPITE